jgi:hypothetical protein
MNDKRKEHRFRATVPLRVQYGKREFLSTTENISRLGTYAEFNKEIAAGETVDVTLTIPSYTQDTFQTGEVRCKGSVFRSTFLRESAGGKYYGIGIFFTVFAQDGDRQKLSQFIDYLTVKEEQDVKEGLRRRREKEETEKIARHSEELHSKETEFQKESLRLLRHISSQLEELQRTMQAEHKKK